MHSLPFSLRRPRILFVSEVATLCHFSRPLVLAGGLDPADYDVHFACTPEYHTLLEGAAFTRWPLNSRPGAEFLENLAAGRRIFELETLRDYVRDDLALIDQVKPDVVVGDMRFSLSVSTALRQVPYLMICNAYWSPYARQRFCVPEVPATRFLGPRVVNALFRLVRPLAFRYHMLPINRLRKEFGLSTLGWDHRRLYNAADHALYADAPELVPTHELPANHHYLGPITWSFPTPLPDWWDRVPRDRPIVYVGLGSSGRIERLPSILAALADLPVTVLASTCGRTAPESVAGNVYWADYLPGKEASARADLVISHGGSASAYVALAAGKPVLGIPSNMDQHLTMHYIERAGAGCSLRAEWATPGRIRAAVAAMLSDTVLRTAALRVARDFAAYDAPARFRALLDTLTARSVPASRALTA
jgi:UDP:flavonoid glycosyltransferase YjiC (YdhE family)